MKRISLIFMSIALSAIIFTSCGDGDKKDDKKTDETPKNTEETVLVDKLTPEKLVAGALITASDLNEAYYAWNNMEVTITGYAFLKEGKLFLGNEEKTDDWNALAECTPLSEITAEYPEGTKATIKGKIIGTSYGKIALSDCEIIEKTDDVAAKGSYVDPFNYHGENISVADLDISFQKPWKGKEVTVIGYYHSTTTSKFDNSPDNVRVDLCAESMGDKLIGCEMAEGAVVPDDIENNRENVKIKGIISGESFGMVGLEGSEIIKE